MPNSLTFQICTRAYHCIYRDLIAIRATQNDKYQDTL